ncbi:MAG TPA: DEAD/DEAH box helicase, partial [Candidatus Pacearchaeota archaeon]|nr:DEAD/DEAH box helicase [Candidatus Pacearchaeota archaeon]
MESIEKFKELGLKQELLDVIQEMDFKEPSEIQQKSIPLVLQGKDVIGNAATGSGKTLAFAAGIIDKVLPRKGIQSLVLAPTRELAEQIAKVIQNFAKKTGITVLEVYGGVGIQNQIDKAKDAEVIVGTPGRVLDHLERRSFDFFNLKILVLDEADRMVDMGFIPDVERIIQQCPIKRQTLLFSATNSADVDYIAKRYMKEPVHVVVEQYLDSKHLQQYFYDTPGNLKFSLLVYLLKEEQSGISMVFCNTRKNVDMVVENLKRQGIRAQAIHGGLVQTKRNTIIQQFYDNKSNILVCTDVAA